MTSTIVEWLQAIDHGIATTRMLMCFAEDTRRCCDEEWYCSIMVSQEYSVLSVLFLLVHGISNLLSDCILGMFTLQWGLHNGQGQQNYK